MTLQSLLSEGPALRWALPVLTLTLIGAEYLWGRRQGRRLYDGGETRATLVIAAGNQVVNGLASGLALLPLYWVWQYRLVAAPLDHWWGWPALFLGVEFCYYWFHYAKHRVRWFWNVHLVHHSATRFNLSAALRLGWGGQLLGGMLFYLPLALLGFPPLAIGGMILLGLFYQFFLHLAEAPSFGPFEWVLNTPTHHRVHHASNEACLDRNYGSVLIVFDRLFGTFAAAPHDEPLRFGLKGDAAPAARPFAVMLQGWRRMIALWRDASGWSGRWHAVFGPP